MITTLDAAQSAPERADRIREIAAEIERRGVNFILFQYVTVQGRVLGKSIPASHFERVAHEGMPFLYVSAGGMVTSHAGELIGPGGATSREGVLLPDLATFQVLPWDSEFGRVFCDHFRSPAEEVDPGAPAASDARANLKRVVAEFSDEFGLRLRTGCEPEMMWFKGRDAIDVSAAYFPRYICSSYHLRHLEDLREVLKRVTRYGQAMGLDMTQADYEDPGQLEMNFMFDDCLATADRLVTYRQICIQAAKELGVYATFMAKPLPGVMANGCHHTLSLWNEDGNVIEPDPGTPLGLHGPGSAAVGGLLAHARGMMALLAPTVNSYARFWDEGMFAPSLVPDWGLDDRTCAVRALPGKIELRSPDAMVNPYLSHAAILAAISDGLVQDIDPGPPMADSSRADAPSPNGAGEPGRQFDPLPATLAEAIDALEADAVVRAGLSDELCQVFVDLKRDEWARSCGAITDWALETYLDYVP